MAHPLVWPKKSFFYSIGNTPPVSLVQDLAPELPANVLLLACGDPRSILYTVFADVADNRNLDFTCCDREPAVLARNILLLTMAGDGVPPSKLWCIFYHFFLDNGSYSILIAQCRTLAQLSSDIKTWKKSKYGKYLRFCTEDTLAEMRKHWLLYLETDNFTIAERESLRESFTSGMKRVREMNGGICIPRAGGVAAMSFLQGNIDSRKNFWSTGLTPSNLTENMPTPHVNPTFAYCSTERQFCVHYGTDPLLSFHLAPALTSTKGAKFIESPTIRDFTQLAMSQFSSWCSAFKDRVSKKSSSNITIRVFSGDALAFCSALYFCGQVVGFSATGIYTRPWSGSQIGLNPEDYGPSSNQRAPLAFNVIETSNLTDHVGLLNVLTVTLPLLEKRPWAVLHTNTLLPSGKINGFPKSALASLALADLPTLSMILGVAPYPYFSHFTTHSDVHEIMAREIFPGQSLQSISWRMPPFAIPGSTTHDIDPSSFALVCDPEKLARFLFSVYVNMFSEEGCLKSSSEDVSERDWAQCLAHYTRRSLVEFLALVEDRLDVDWDMVMPTFMNLVKSDRRIFRGLKSYQELITDLHFYGLYTPLSMGSLFLDGRHQQSSSLFRGWNDIPPVVCVVLKVPRLCLCPLEEMKADTIGTPQLLCQTEDVQGQNIFYTIQPIFGRFSVSHNKGEPTISIHEDQRGWSGDSPLIISFYAPAGLLLSKDPKEVHVGLHLRPTPSNSHELLSKLGTGLTIYSTTFADREHVQVVRYRPDNIGGPEIMRNMSAISSMARAHNKTRKVTLNFNNAATKVTSLTIRQNITDARAAKLLSEGAVVSMKPQSDTVIVISFGTYVQRLIYPFPIRGGMAKCRIARKSSYIEVEVPVRQSFQDFTNLSLNPFPIARQHNNLLNIHYVNLDVLPALNFPMPEEKFRWLNPHLACSFSKEEMRVKERPNPRDHGVLVSVKQSIGAIFFDYLGIGNSKIRHKVFGLSNGGVYAMIFVNDIKLDLASHTIIVDACVVPYHNTAIAKIHRVLDGRPYNSILTLAGEARAWRLLLPALAERCRTWKHSAKCEYLLKGIPAALEDLTRSPLCSCGKGKNLGAFGKLNEFAALHEEATRIAIGPLFYFSFAEDITAFPTQPSNTASTTSPSPVSSSSSSCNHCGEPGKPNLMVCSRCKKAKYCSSACQNSNWKAHKMFCTPP